MSQILRICSLTLASVLLAAQARASTFDSELAAIQQGWAKGSYEEHRDLKEPKPKNRLIT